MNAKLVASVAALSVTLVALADITGLTDLTDLNTQPAPILTNCDTSLGSANGAFNIKTATTQSIINSDGNKNRFGGMVTSSSSLWVQYTFATNTVVNAYRIWNQAANVSPVTRAPKDFYFDGSLDGKEWVRLDSRSNETNWKMGEPRVFEFPNKTAYKVYRMTFTANNGDKNGYVIIQELEYFCRPTDPNGGLVLRFR